MNWTRPKRAPAAAVFRPALAILAAATAAGCGTQVASSGATTAAKQGTTAANSAVAAACDGTGLATKVTALRAIHLVQPARIPALKQTNTNPAVVRALFRDLCAIVAHQDRAVRAYHCPMDVGVGYAGAFYDGARVLASYTFSITGCQRVTLTAGRDGPTQSAVVAGTAAAAAPSLEPDFANVVGTPARLIFYPGNYSHGSG
jgi:hypothetical protein